MHQSQKHLQSGFYNWHPDLLSVALTALHFAGYPGGIFAPFIPGDLEELKLKELKNGRLAMWALSTYLLCQTSAPIMSVSIDVLVAKGKRRLASVHSEVTEMLYAVLTGSPSWASQWRRR